MILDFGCGDGHKWSKDKQVVGIDINEDRLSTAKTRVLAVRCDGRCLPFKDSAFSLVISDCVLEHISEYENAVRELGRVLVPGGRCRFLQPVDNDPIFVAARRIAKSWMGDRILSYFNSSQLLVVLSRSFKITSVEFVPNAPFAGLLGFFNMSVPRILVRVDQSYGRLSRKIGAIHWMIIVEGTARTSSDEMGKQ